MTVIKTLTRTMTAVVTIHRAIVGDPRKRCHVCRVYFRPDQYYKETVRTPQHPKGASVIWQHHPGCPPKRRKRH